MTDRAEPASDRSKSLDMPAMDPVAVRAPLVAPALAPAWQPSRADILDASADDSQLHLVAQPIADLGRGTVVGFEVLSRFLRGTPDVWFAAATEYGLSPRLDSLVIRRSLARLADLPRNTFLTINVEPHSLLDPGVQKIFNDHGNLQRLVIELTEHSRIIDFASLRGPLALLRSAGAMIAADDVGAGYAGLQMLLEMRPQIVKIDRALVHDIHRDPAKRAVVRMLGELCSRIDAWVLGEGIESQDELLELMRLGVPLAQGFFLSHPKRYFENDLSSKTTALIRTQAESMTAADQVKRIMDIMALVPATSGEPPEGSVIEVDAWSRPHALVLEGRRVDRPLVVQANETVGDVASRVVGRVGDLESVVVVDANGRALGTVHPRRLLNALAEQRRAPN